MEPRHVINFTVFKIVQDGGEDKEEFYSIQWNSYEHKTLEDVLTEKYARLVGLDHHGVSELTEYDNGRMIHHLPSSVWHENLNGKVFKINLVCTKYGPSEEVVRKFKRPKLSRDE